MDKKITFLTKMAKNVTARWAFNTKNWNPTEEDLLLASSCIQTEEKTRISRFVFQNDAKSSLIGRLMIRKFAHLATNIPYEEITLIRDANGKPIIKDVPLSYFNISHQGDFVVLAGDTQKQVGIDVMKLEAPPNKDIQEFFRIMNRQFGQREWGTIKSHKSEVEQIASFYRHWCLKESYVKNVGVGITVNLAEIIFNIKTGKLNVGEIANDTTLAIKGFEKDKWIFEETLLDDRHMVAVAFELINEYSGPIEYEFLSFEQIVNEAKSFAGSDLSFAKNFLKKEIR